MYKEMIEAEMKESEEFSKRSFGMKVGDGFPEMVRELVSSEVVAAKLYIGILAANLLGREAVKALDIDSGKPQFEKAILDNLLTFEQPLSLFYWGVQVGRKMERESIAALRDIENHK